MSALAKVFVVFNFLLSLVFFGTSATLFLTRQDMRSQYETFRQEATNRNDALRAKIDEQAQVLKLQSEAINLLRSSEQQLAVNLSREKENVKTQEVRANQAESDRKTAQDLATAAHNSLKEQEATNQDLLTKLQDANEKRDQAITEQKLAIEDRNRIKRDLDQVQRELHDARVTYKNLADEHETLTTVLAAYQKIYGPDVPGVAPPIDALVDAVDSTEGLVVLSAGRDQKVKEGYEFTIYRDDQFIGKVKVTKVYTDLSGAEIVFPEDASIRPGDRATTALLQN